jgi:hypothetical protein
MKIRRAITAVAGAALVAATAAIGASGTAAAGASSSGPGAPRPMYTVLHTAGAGAASPSFALPTWSYTYKYRTVAYRDRFVGTSPTTGKTTTIPTYIIPIKLTYGSFTTDPTAPFGGGGSAVTRTLASPVFQSSIDFVQGGTDVGTTQYIDAFQRAALWGRVKNHPTYHVLLSAPTVEPVQAVTVPPLDGSTASPYGTKTILANISWFDPLAQSLLSSLSIPSDSLPIFVTTQAYLSNNSGRSGCCIGGYHNWNGASAYAEFSYIQQSGVFSQDVSALSHEVGEYVDDPLTNNTDVPASCGTNGNEQQIYEVGDPLEVEANFGDYAYTVGSATYHLQDLVLPPYFGASGAISVNRWKTFQGTSLKVCQNGG